MTSTSVLRLPLLPGVPSPPDSQPPSPHDEKLFDGDGGR
jgi:hypothetical protein